MDISVIKDGLVRVNSEEKVEVQMPEREKQRAVKELRIEMIRATIWRNDANDGVWYNVIFDRRYRDGEASFGRDDLLALAKLADLSHTWIIEVEGAERDVYLGLEPGRGARTDSKD